MPSQQERSYAAAHFALELDGVEKNVGLFKSIEGGSIKTDVMTYQRGGGFDRWKQLGKPKFEDLKLQVGAAMGKPFYDWIAGFFDRRVVRKTGAIIAADFYYVERARRRFTEALIKELVFPKLEGQDKSAAYLNVTLSVEEIVFAKGNGRKIDGTFTSDQQKTWTANNFRFRLDGFAGPCTRVSKVDSFTIKQNVTDYHAGGFRAPIKLSSQLEFPNLTFYVPETDAQPFLDHFARRGVAGEVPGRLTGSLETFDSSPEKKPLFEVSFTGADILSVTPDKHDSGSEDIKQVKIELYTEQMGFKYLG